MEDISAIEVTDDIHRTIAQKFGYWDHLIIRNAIAHYKHDDEISNIPHYVKFNRYIHCKHNCIFIVIAIWY